MNDLLQILKAYLLEAKGLGECAEWFAGVDWDDPDLTPDMKEALGLFELLITEVAEGVRAEREFWEAASDFVASKAEGVFAKQGFSKVSVVAGTAGSFSLPQVEVVSGDLESQSGSISPQVVLL